MPRPVPFQRITFRNSLLGCPVRMEVECMGYWLTSTKIVGTVTALPIPLPGLRSTSWNGTSQGRCAYHFSLGEVPPALSTGPSPPGSGPARLKPSTEGNTGCWSA